jgi:4-amino-4-deoxy-L-arabinose transferase-like glycosyltransferase
MKDPSETPRADEAVEPALSEAHEPAETPRTEGDVVSEAPAPQEDASTSGVAEGVDPVAATTAAPAPEAPPRAVRETPNKVKPRDLALTVLSLLGLAALHHHDGHLRVGVPLGIALTFVAALGVLGLLGDSPLDLRGDEASPAEPAKPWYLREGWWVILFSGALYIPMAGAYGLWDPWETHYSEVAREILSRDDWITTWWGQEGWFMSKPVLIFWMSALGMGLGSTFGLRIAADSGPQFQEWCIRLPIVLLAMGALFGLYRAVAAVWGKRAGVLVAMVLATMPHWFFLAHQAMTDMPFVAPLTLAIAALMRAVTVGDGGVTPHRVRLFGVPLRVSLWHLTVGAMLVTWLPQVSYLFTRPMIVSCPEDARMQQCTEMLRLNRIGMSQFPVETYFYGSFGNSADTLASSVPGSPQWERLASVVPFFPSAVQALVWLVLGAAALWLLRRVRRARDLYFVLVFFWCAISTMGKGPAGLAIPVAVAGTWLVVSGEWRLLRHARLLTGLLVFLVVGMPWYIAIVGRLGNEFIDRFVVHDIINRTVVGVHGDTGSLRYFLWQLGYAMFPWSGLVPVAVLGWRQVVPGDATPEQRHVARIGMLWFLSSFVLFSAMITKFHHYIFPAVPGAAVLVGLLLDRMLGAHTLRHARNPAGSLAALGAGITAAVLGVANFRGSPRGAIPHAATELPPGSVGLGVALVLTGVGLVVLSWWLSRGEDTLERVQEHDAHLDEASPAGGLGARVAAFFSADGPMVEARAKAAAESPERYAKISHGAMALGAAAVVAFVARDLMYRGEVRPPGYQRLLQLFTYQYERMWPTESFDYYPIMVGFGVVTAVVSASLAVHRWRAHAVRAMVVLAAVWCAWALDFYMVDVSRHWSQRTLFERYFRMRQPRTDEPRGGDDARYTHDICGAYMMNWKGENFYTGGRCAMLDCGDLPFCSNHARQWMENHRGQRVFFVTERSHGSSIMSHVRATGGTARELTDAWDQNKFVLIEATVGAGTGTR